MAKLRYLIGIFVLLCSCSANKRLAEKAFYHALVGQNEMTIYSRLGAPTNVIATTDGGKLLKYEFYGKGLLIPLSHSGVAEESYTATIKNKKTGAVYNIVTNPETAVSEYSNYQTDIASLNVFIDKHGKCVNYEQNLPKEQLEYYYDQLRKYIPED